MKIAYLGPRGTFTEEAVYHLIAQVQNTEGSESVEFIPKQTIPDCLVACERGEVKYALVPIENSIEGSVNMTLDWIIHETQLPLQAEITLPIQQSALIHPNFEDNSLEQIEKVFSHPHAIAQCHSFLREKCPHSEWVYMKSTAEAAEHVSKHPKEKWLAIGTSLAGKNYGLTICCESIQDYDNNRTRFVLIGQNQVDVKDEKQDSVVYKTSLLLTLPEDFPGALYQALAAFSWRRLNMTRIESRPTKKALGSYVFLIDLDHSLQDVLVPAAIAEIEALGLQVRILGSYPCFTKQKEA